MFLNLLAEDPISYNPVAESEPGNITGPAVGFPLIKLFVNILPYVETVPPKLLFSVTARPPCVLILPVVKLVEFVLPVTFNPVLAVISPATSKVEAGLVLSKPTPTLPVESRYNVV